MDRPDPQRLRHHHGETLAGGDFAAQAAQDDQLRWWHNRAVHREYGVVRGLRVSVTDRVAVVEPGLAYDCHGRELILAEARRVPIPADAATPDLVLVRSGDGVALCWVPAGSPAPGGGVRLGDAAQGAPADRPLARPFARPRIGRGATIPGATAWEPWTETWIDYELHLGIQVDVDTSAAGFTAPPCYFTQLTGSTWNALLPLLLLVPFEHVARQRRDGFTFRLLVPWLYLSEGPRRQRPDFREAVRGLAQITDLAVTWTGIQQREEGRP